MAIHDTVHAATQAVDVAQSAVTAAGSVTNAAASAFVATGEGVKAAGNAALTTASAVANSPTTSKVGGFLADKFMSYWQAAEDITKQIVPQAMEAILWVIRVDAISALVYALALIAAFIVAGVVILKIWKGFNKKLETADANEWRKSDSISLSRNFSVGLLTVMLSVVILITNNTWTKAFDVWTYATIYKPELYLAKLAVDGGTAKLKEYVNTKSSTVK